MWFCVSHFSVNKGPTISKAAYALRNLNFQSFPTVEKKWALVFAQSQWAPDSGLTHPLWACQLFLNIGGWASPKKIGLSAPQPTWLAQVFINNAYFN